MKDRCISHIVVVILFLIQTSAFAQNNTYKINDSVYEYFMRTQNNLRKKDLGLRMADTLLAKAKAAHDIKAQCIALFTKNRYFLYNNLIDKANSEFKLVSPFILSTPYKQYFYGMWEGIIYYYINHKQQKEGYQEISLFGKHAMTTKFGFGLMRYYAIEGDLHYQRMSYLLAIQYYLKAVDYGLKDKVLDIYNIYRQLSLCYLRLHRWKSTEEMLFKCIETSPKGNDFLPYCILLSLYSMEEPQDSAKVDRTYELLQQKFVEYRKQNISLGLYNEAMYNYYMYYKHNALMADTYIINKPFNTFLRDSLIYYSKQASQYEQAGDDKHAAMVYKQYANLLSERRIDDSNLILDLYVPQLEYQKVEHDKKSMQQTNAIMQLTRLRNDEQMMLISNERNNLLLLQRTKEHHLLQNQYAMQQIKFEQDRKNLQAERIRSFQQKKTEKLERDKKQWRILAFFMLIVSISIVALIITYIKRTNRRRLESDKEKAEKAKQMKSLFFQNMNHEIRSPLNAIIGFNDVLNGDMADSIPPEQKTEFIKMISTNCQLLQTLVNDVLDLSNFESGTYHLNPVDVDIYQLCRTTLESMRGRELPGIQLVLKTNPEGPFILHTDAQRLQQVLINYMSNACKYTEQGSITLSYEVTDKLVRFAVTDTGRGVKPEDAEKVFQRFQMLDKSKRGTGLGLHICRIVASLLHSKAYVDTSYTGGARFVFDHPIKLILSLLIAMSLIMPASAQKLSKTMNMKPELYQYYKKIENYVNQPLGYRMSDTLFMKGQQQHDYFAQGYALENKVRYGRYSNNEQLMLSQFERCKSFSLKYRTYDPLYSSWSYVNNFYLLRRQYSKAMEQLVAFQSLTAKLKDEAGISAYFFCAGSFYFSQERFATAISYYMQSLGYKGDEKYSTYTLMGESYYFLNQYKNGVECLKKAINDPFVFSDKVRSRSFCFLCRCYSMLGDEPHATEYMDKLKSIKESHPQWITDELFYGSQFLYELHIKKNKDRASESLLKLNYGAATINYGDYYLAQGDYPKAKDAYKKVVDKLKTWMQTEPALQLESYTSNFDFGRAMEEFDRMSMNSIQLQMMAARSTQNLLRLSHQRSLLLLNQTEDSMKRKKSDVALQKMILEQQQSQLSRTRYMNETARKQKELMSNSSAWRNAVLVITLVLFISLLGIYIMYLMHKEKLLRAETLLAEREERSKNRFFQNVNNKISDPLHTIVSLNEKLNEASSSQLSPETRAGMMKQLDASGKYLATLVNDVLDISKMESGTYKLQMQEIDVHNFCTSLINELSPQTPNLVELKFECSSSDGVDPLACNLYTDEQRLRFVLLSLIQNSFLYTHSGSVTLSYEAFIDKIIFCVTDTGIGIPPELIDAVFNLDELEVDKGDAGLSLHIVKLTADLIHGKAWLDTSYMSGARFYFEHPVNH